MVELARYKPVLIVVAGILTAVGIGFNIAAIASPSWEVVNMREFQTEHQHGLWLDCARNVKTKYSNGASTTVYGTTHCTYKFDFTYGESELLDDSVPDMENLNHIEFKAFQIAYMIMIAVTVLSGLGTIFIMVGACRNPDSVMPILVFTMTSLFSAALSFAVFLSYFFLSHTGDNRWVKGVTAIYDTDFGDAYYFEQYATVTFLSSFAIGMLLLKLLRYFINFNRKASNNSTDSSSFLISDDNKQNYFSPLPPQQLYSEYDFEPPQYIKKLPTLPTSVSSSAACETEYNFEPIASVQPQERFAKNFHFTPSVSSTSSVFTSTPKNLPEVIAHPQQQYIKNTSFPPSISSISNLFSSIPKTLPERIAQPQQQHIKNFSLLPSVSSIASIFTSTPKNFPDELAQAQQQPTKNFSFPSSVSSKSSVFASQRSFEPETANRETINRISSQTPLLLGLETKV